MAEIDIKANVCCAKYNPESMYEIAVGAADHTVLTYDLRKSDKAVHTFKGMLSLVLCSIPIAGHQCLSSLEYWLSFVLEPMPLLQSCLCSCLLCCGTR